MLFTLYTTFFYFTIQATAAPQNLHHEHHRQNKRQNAQCQLPNDPSIVAITPGSANAGWAMSPDQACRPGNYCPYACQSGLLMQQWDPQATSYNYPMSMHGGLYCNSDGTVSKPFPNKPYCASGLQNLRAVGNGVAFCQTVLPGNEAMLIPTLAYSGGSVLAVPDPSYWASTAAHYYVNAPGISAAEGCVWGSSSRDVGNWAPYVAGANADASGNTYVKIGWNPVYMDDPSWASKSPSYGMKVECDGNCPGLPCAIDPSMGPGCSSSGCSDNSFCVVTVPNGVSARIVVTGGQAAYNAQIVANQAALALPTATVQTSSSTSIYTSTSFQSPTVFYGAAYSSSIVSSFTYRSTVISSGRSISSPLSSASRSSASFNSTRTYTSAISSNLGSAGRRNRTVTSSSSFAPNMALQTTNLPLQPEPTLNQEPLLIIKNSAPSLSKYPRFIVPLVILLQILYIA